MAATLSPSVQELADRANSGNAKTVNPEIATLLNKAEKEDSDKQYDAALTDALKARGAALSNFEKLKVNQTLTQIYMDNGDVHDAAGAAESAADLPNIPRGELPDVLTNACILATAVYDYDKAANYARQMQDLKLSDERSQRIIKTALDNAPAAATAASH